MKEHNLTKEPIAFIETPKNIAKLMVSLIGDFHASQTSINILDSGCGKGVFLKQLIEANYCNIEGIL